MSVLLFFTSFRIYLCSVHGLLYCPFEVIFRVLMSSGRIFDSALGPIVKRLGGAVNIS